jgi:hypothetical protein
MDLPSEIHMTTSFGYNIQSGSIIWLEELENFDDATTIVPP